MLQSRQYLALGFEALQLRAGFVLQDFDGDALLEVALYPQPFIYLASCEEIPV
jgi:hypothetical protein